jgi:myo-inositol-1-phosphate synthase
MMKPEKPKSKLAVLLPGMGAVATTFIAGVLLARRGLGLPVGSLSQLGTIRTSEGIHRVKDYVPLAGLDDLEFGGWDVFPDDAFAAAEHAGVLEDKHLRLVKEELSAIRPMPAAFYPAWVRRLQGPNTQHRP